MKLSFLILIATAGAMLGDDLQLTLVKQEAVKQRLEAGQVPNSKRQQSIREMFASVGCTAREQQIDHHLGNVICVLPGETDSVITVGGHFDFIDSGQGMVDDWSGTAMLPSLYETLKDKKRKHTFVFVAFAREEQGLVGSAYYVKSLSADEREQVAAFVNLECLGLGPPLVWHSRANPVLLQYLLLIAKAVQIPLKGANIEQVGDDDSHSFLSKKIDVVTIHSVTSQTLEVLHSPRDKLAAVHLQDYYDAYRLTAFYLALLDLKLR